MASNFQKKTIQAAKNLIVAGYAASLFIPYRVEKKDGETTYHAPLIKLSFKTGSSDGCHDDIHTYTFSTFGLLSDQIDTAKKLYIATKIRYPYMKESAKKKIENTIDVIIDTTENTISELKSKAIDTVIRAENTVDQFINNLF